ncbi:hypothetical protein BG97_3103 [Burkholderia pseudomallei 7894]|nr:hypothetical protein BG97_3103 [Burkholderia pseudomallei 7894]
MCGQNVFVSHDIDDIAIAIALSIDEAHRSDRQKRSLDAQIDRVLRKWRDRGYASGSLHDAKATRASPGAPEARRPDVAFWLPESERIVRHGSVLLKARDGRDVRIVEDPIGSVQADASAVRPRPRRMRTFEFV